MTDFAHRSGPGRTEVESEDTAVLPTKTSLNLLLRNLKRKQNILLLSVSDPTIISNLTCTII